MDQNDGPEARISKEKIGITLMMDLREISAQLIGISLQDETLHMGITIRTMENHVINAQISHSLEVMENELELNRSIIEIETGETMETFIVLDRLKGETFHKIVHTANQEVISLIFLLSVDPTIDLRLVLRFTNKNSNKIIAARHLRRFGSPQPAMPLLNYHTSVR